MKKAILLHSVVLSMLCLTHADETDIDKDFESLLNNVSELATKKSLNVDYLPSVVTIIDAQTYRDAGIQTIAEALDMFGYSDATQPDGIYDNYCKRLENA